MVNITITKIAPNPSKKLPSHFFGLFGGVTTVVGDGSTSHSSITSLEKLSVCSTRANSFAVSSSSSSSSSSSTSVSLSFRLVTIVVSIVVSGSNVVVVDVQTETIDSSITIISEAVIILLEAIPSKFMTFSELLARETILYPSSSSFTSWFMIVSDAPRTLVSAAGMLLLSSAKEDVVESINIAVECKILL